MGGLPESITLPTPKLSLTIEFTKYRTMSEELCGIYVFRGKHGECLYVGQSKCFRKRFYGHERDSPFNALIYNVDLYVIHDPYVREIFETVFIDRMKPYYNRAKAFSKVRASQDAIYFDIAALEDEVMMLEDEKSEILDDYAWGVADDCADEDYRPSEALGELMRTTRRIPEIDDEVAELSRKIRRLYRKISS
ncbi:GIY-YIG nuclease family protein [Sporosarcina phage Lietuvens]|nr:GIY-YIG nuclease family protein [Sporosarcina phage Lietuvens]